MRVLVEFLREVIGLFVDDGSLALAILGAVLMAGVVSITIPSVPLAAGAVLLVGCLAVLVINVAIASRRVARGVKRRGVPTSISTPNR